MAELTGTYTVGQLMDRLSEFDEDTPVVIMPDEDDPADRLLKISAVGDWTVADIDEEPAEACFDDDGEQTVVIVGLGDADLYEHERDDPY